MSLIEYPILDKKLADVVEHPRHVRLCRGETKVIVGANREKTGRIIFWHRKEKRGRIGKGRL